MKLSLTRDTFIAFLTVVALAGTAVGLADETEAALKPQAMAKLGIHRMPNGEWMQEAPAAASEATTTEETAPAGIDHSGHITRPEAAPDQSPARNQNPPAEEFPPLIDHEAMGH